MSFKNAIAPLGLTLGLSAGVGFAVHEVGALHFRADSIEACIQHPTVNCDEGTVPSLPEANDLLNESTNIWSLGLDSFRGGF